MTWIEHVGQQESKIYLLFTHRVQHQSGAEVLLVYSLQHSLRVPVQTVQDQNPLTCIGLDREMLSRTDKHSHSLMSGILWVTHHRSYRSNCPRMC